MISLRKFTDAFRVPHVNVHEPRIVLVFGNPREGCASRTVPRVLSGNASLSFGRYITQADMDSRYERIMSANI